MIGVGREERRPAAAFPELQEQNPPGSEERNHWLALAQLPGVGPVTFATLLHRHGSAAAAWAAAPSWLPGLARQAGESAAVHARLAAAGVAAVAGRLQAALSAVGGRAVIATDSAYPSALWSVHPRPPVLYVRGELTSLESPTVAVVGTRRASGYGRAVATEIADELARAGATVVSGLALGIDGVAHEAALGGGGASVAVLPSPIDHIYPGRHAGLADRLVASGGAVISELAPGQRVGKPDFARRNRIIAGLAMAVVIVEAPDRSGALLTAAAATELGREVYAVPGSIHAVGSRGSNRLIADHLASMVTSAVGLLHRIGVDRGEVPISVRELSESEGLILAQLLDRPGSIEELLARTRYPTSLLASSLTLLEARGLVTSYGGATFHPTLTARRLAGQPAGRGRRPA